MRSRLLAATMGLSSKGEGRRKGKGKKNGREKEGTHSTNLPQSPLINRSLAWCGDARINPGCV